MEHSFIWWTVIVMAIVAAIDPMWVATIVVMLDDSLAPVVAQHHRDASAPTPPGSSFGAGWAAPECRAAGPIDISGCGFTTDRGAADLRSPSVAISTCEPDLHRVGHAAHRPSPHNRCSNALSSQRRRAQLGTSGVDRGPMP